MISLYVNLIDLQTVYLVFKKKFNSNIINRNIYNITINLNNNLISKFYFFKSNISNDEMSGISVFTTSLRKAYALAFKQFVKHNCKEVPVLLAI